MERPILRLQEIPFDHSDSNNFFQPTADKPFVVTFPALEVYSQETMKKCLTLLQEQAEQQNGLDFIQVFDDPERRSPLWIIEEQVDDTRGKITALLPEDY